MYLFIFKKKGRLVEKNKIIIQQALIPNLHADRSHTLRFLVPGVGFPSYFLFLTEVVTVVASNWLNGQKEVIGRKPRSVRMAAVRVGK